MSALKSIVICGGAVVAGVVGTVSATVGTELPVCTTEYEIQTGDTLLEIAQDQLGTVFAVNALIASNKALVGANPDLIFAGDNLKIPCDVAVTEPVDWAMLPDVQTLSGLLDEPTVQVLDIRDAGQLANGVIPGAIHVAFPVWQDETEPRLSEAALSEVLGLSGLRLDQPIIIVNGKAGVVDLNQSTAVLRLLRAAGADHLAILRDGYHGWYQANLPVVAVPALKDPYEAVITYRAKGQDGTDQLHDLVTDSSAFWQAAVRAHPGPDGEQTRQGFFARLIRS